jgi:hypothetical protein
MLLAVIAAASLSARLANVGLYSDDAQTALRMTMNGAPQQVVVRRDGEVTRVTLKGTDLGAAFSGGSRFQWLWTAGAGGPGPRKVHCPEALWIERNPGEVTISLRLPPDVAIEPHQEARAVLLVFRRPPAAAPDVLRADAGPAPPLPTLRPAMPTEAPTAPPAIPLPTTAAVLPTSAPHAESSPSNPDRVAQLLGTLSSPDAGGTTPGEPATTEGTDAEALYRRLFPHVAPTAAAAAAAEPAGAEPDPGRDAAPEQGFKFGVLTFKPTLHVAYMNAKAGFIDGTGTARDQFLEIQPGLGVGTSLWQGRLRANYAPTLRSFGGFQATDNTSHHATASLDLASRGAFQLSVNDAWTSGILEAQEVDPGGEYVFGLRRFSRNSFGLRAHHEVAPRWALEAGGGLNRVRFKDANAGAFFDYDSWTADFGVEHDITPNLRTALSYLHDRVPRPAERPEAESTANTVQVVVSGDATARVTTQATLGYRQEDHPLVAEDGRHYRGLVIGAAVSRLLGVASNVTLSGSRRTLLSAFEGNGFYVSNQVQTDTTLRIPHSFYLEASAGYRWNEYQTVASEIGEPRSDKIFDWRLGLRRPLKWGSAAASYQRQRRRSNIDRFQTTTDRLTIEITFDLFRAAGLR